MSNIWWFMNIITLNAIQSSMFAPFPFYFTQRGNQIPILGKSKVDFHFFIQKFVEKEHVCDTMLWKSLKCLMHFIFLLSIKSAFHVLLILTNEENHMLDKKLNITTS